MDENLGIPFLTKFYINKKEEQNYLEEAEKILDFLNLYLKKYKGQKAKAEFINYGNTELVFVLKINNEPKYTCLIGQPALRFGDVKKEAEYLKEYKKIDNNVVAPIDYFTDGEHELFVTPYIYQARCIASDNNKWGIYIPEPTYRFQTFTDEQRSIVNKCMIANLVKLFDIELNEGIACCKLGGGDFMLEKGWELEEPTIENTLKKMYLIAARKKIKCSLENYINLIKNEFSKVTINQNGYFLNNRARAAMSEEEINAGIELGLKLRRSAITNIIKK